MSNKAPTLKNRKHPQLWQSYLWWDELVAIRKRHVTRIKHVESGRSNMDAQIERDIIEHMQLEALIRVAERQMQNYGRAIGPIWDHATSIKGFGGNIAAQMFAHINDIAEFDTVSKLWRFAGKAVVGGKAERGTVGEKRPYNARLKSVCYLLSEQFIRHQTPGYVDLYYTEKARQRAQHPEPLKENGRWRYNDGHLDMRARRKVEKIFLQHLWLRWRELEGMRVSAPFAHDRLGHENIVRPEDCGWPPFSAS